ncbi:MAG: single-stranded DNA-binding protein [Spirochaetia bacterium]|jgi:single-strand DNA-binding protein|nr:single-stranded DNA-binding protein [Spirochaetia bacterium]
MNNVNEVGGLVRDAELKTLPSGTSCLNFSIAVSEYMGAGKEDWNNYFDCVMFGKRASSLAQYMGKGQKVAIEGKLHQDRWEKEGEKRSKVIIKVNNIDLVGAKKSATQEQQPKSNSFDNGFQDDSEIPF